jgi:hypothetical protein
MSDKRKVSTDALETLGTIIGPNEKRDAIHLAVIPVKANEVLHAGQHVSLQDGLAESQGDTIGIVDPFLTTPVAKGEHFWLVIYPRVITSLRHVWTHPQLPDEAPEPMTPDAKASENWLRTWCATSEISYDDLIEVSKRGKIAFEKGSDMIQYYGENSWEIADWDDNYLMCKGSDAHGDIQPEVWNHVAIVIGREPVARPQHFTCSC